MATEVLDKPKATPEAIIRLIMANYDAEQNQGKTELALLELCRLMYNAGWCAATGDDK